MSFNTQHCQNFITKKIDFEIMAKTIKNSAADVVVLNEIRGKGAAPDYDQQTEILSNLTELKYYYFAKAIDLSEGPYGNAILSRYPLIDCETIPIPDPITDEYVESRCLLKAKLKNGITVLGTHFGLTPEEQKNAVITITKHIPQEKCVLMGDFNIEPDNEILNPIKNRMVDTADYFDRKLLSFPSDNPLIKIDYIFVTPDIDVIAADIPSVIASDHRPYILEANI